VESLLALIQLKPAPPELLAAEAAFGKRFVQSRLVGRFPDTQKALQPRLAEQPAHVSLPKAVAHADDGLALPEPYFAMGRHESLAAGRQNKVPLGAAEGLQVCKQSLDAPLQSCNAPILAPAHRIQLLL
jgi:hypothetical protein